MSFVHNPDGSSRLFMSRRDEYETIVEFDVSYRPSSGGTRLELDSEPYFLAERYASYTVSRTGELVRGDLIHEPWVVHEAEVDLRVNGIWRSLGVRVVEENVKFYYSPGVDVVLWDMVDVDKDGFLYKGKASERR